jgi:protein ImuB
MVCVWLPRFQTGRIERKERGGKARPEALAIIASGKGGNRLVAVNAKAEAAGLRPGMLLTEAAAMEPGLRAVRQDKRGEAADLKRLGLWCRLYAPWTGMDAPDGLWIDMTGGTHLFGGEERLLHALERRFNQAGFALRAAIAGTHSAAWAMARFAKAPLSIVPAGAERECLAPLPVRALRIAGDDASLLDRLGLKTIGEFYALPRAALRARFGAGLAARLDQALGRSGEAKSMLAYEPAYSHRLAFSEPVECLDTIRKAASLLIERMAAQLQGDGKGARRFTFALFDTQGGCTDVTLALARPSGDARHLKRLMNERLTALEGGFGENLAFDAAALFASRVETITASQTGFASGHAARQDEEQAFAGLLDRLTARLGQGAVRRFDFHESHIPERASVSAKVLDKPAPPCRPAANARPFLLLPRAEPVRVIAELPDYPPRLFVWRRARHRIVKAEGPERIAPEWWRPREERTRLRDYYSVEDEEGRRFWLYREGLYTGEAETPRWFLHGIFP